MLCASASSSVARGRTITDIHGTSILITPSTGDQRVFDSQYDGYLVTAPTAHACGVRNVVFLCYQVMREAHHLITHAPVRASGEATSAHPARRRMPWSQTHSQIVFESLNDGTLVTRLRRSQAFFLMSHPEFFWKRVKPQKK